MSRGDPFSRDFSWCTGMGTRWLLRVLPEIAELYSVLLCAWSPPVEVIIAADISTESALDTEDGDMRAHTWESGVSRLR